MNGHDSRPKMSMSDSHVALAEESRGDQDDEQERDGEEHVHDAHQDVVGHAAEVAGDGTHDHADEAGDEHRERCRSTSRCARR